jgi:uncharacterized protein
LWVTKVPETNLLPLHNRKRELAELERAWRSGKPELLLALGRRRAGKSYLLRRFMQGRAGFYYQATKTTAREQLRALGEAAAAESPQSGLGYGSGFRSWDAFFEYIVERAGGRPFALILDEVPYLLEAVRGFGTILQKQWDNALQDSKIKLILSGSYISAMTRLTAADQPLHGRRTGRLHFASFNYLDAAAFVPGYAAVDRLLTYGIFGGLPGQLAVIDPERPLAENVADHLLNPAGRLADEAERLLDAFTREGGVHYSLIRAIADGEHRWSRITSRVGKNSASVSRPLEWLQQMELIAKVIPVTDTPPGNPKKSLYRLADPYLAFWYRFVAPLRATGAVEVLTPSQLWERHVSPRLSEYMGSVFENICRTFVSRGAHPGLPFLPDRVGEWWSDDQQDQIDVVALGPNGEVLLGECKWGNPTHQDVELLERRRDIIAGELRGIRRVHLALFTSSPTIKDRKLAEQIKQGEILHLSADEVLRSG